MLRAVTHIFRVLALAIISFGLAFTAQAEPYWGDKGSQCKSATKVWHARIYGLGPFDDWMAICKRSRWSGDLPTRCLDKAPFGVWGEWDEKNHPDCAAKWTQKGEACRGPNKVWWARISGHGNQDWNAVCKRTPWSGDLPDRCLNKEFGAVFGEWDGPNHPDCAATWTQKNYECRGTTKVSYARITGDGQRDWIKTCKQTRWGDDLPSRCLNKEFGAVFGEWDERNHADCAAKWEPIKKDHCVAKNMPQYSARLKDLPSGTDAFTACSETSIKHKGKDAYPVTCTEIPLIVTTEMWGEWVFEDESCEGARWDKPKRDYCTGPGKRQYSSILRDIPPGQSWEVACRQASANIQGTYFERPNRCQKNFQMWGEFEINDASCMRDERSAGDIQLDNQALEMDRRIEQLQSVERFDAAVRRVTEPDNAEVLLRDILNSDGIRGTDIDTASFMVSTGGSFALGYDHAEGNVIARTGPDQFACYRTWSNAFTAGLQAGGGGAGVLSLSRGGIDTFRGESNGFVAGGSVGPAGYTSGFHWAVGNEDGAPDVIAYQPGVGAGFEVQVAYAHTWTEVGEPLSCNFN